MKNILNGLGVKNMSDLILKEIYDIYEIKKPYERANQKIQNN